MSVQKHHVISWLKQLAVVFRDNKDFLTKLDAEIGDADHGLNMSRGFDKVAEKLPLFEQKCMGTVFKQAGMTLLSSVGGASGPLYGTFFIKAAQVLTDKEEATLEQFLAALDQGVKGIVVRGRARPGDKTMCDVWWPTLATMQAAFDRGQSLTDVMDAALHTAEEAVRATIPMQARKGRASYLGERSIGHQDPGATSSMLMIKTLKDVINA